MATNIDIAQLTPYEDVNDILSFFTKGMIQIFEENLVGVYLTGSLSYQAFNYHSSDIDVTVILQRPVASDELDTLRNFHTDIEDKFDKWSRRLECSYTPMAMLPNILPPKEPRPWYWGGEGVLYAEAPYGNEWIINKYLLYNYAIPLFGPDFKKLTDPVDIVEVQKASIRDLFVEWEPRKIDREWFKSPQYEAYLILNLCRILYTVICQAVATKQTAASWAKRTYGEPWNSAIDAAERWQYGMDLNLQEQAIEFIDFVIDQVETTELYHQLRDEIKSIRLSRAPD